MTFKSIAEKMDKRISVKYLVESQDSFGAADATWTLSKEVWAKIEPVSVRDFMSGSMQSEITHKITTRASGITADMRIYYGSRIFEIKGILNKDEKGAEFTIMAKEIA